MVKLRRLNGTVKIVIVTEPVTEEKSLVYGTRSPLRVVVGIMQSVRVVSTDFVTVVVPGDIIDTPVTKVVIR